MRSRFAFRLVVALAAVVALSASSLEAAVPNRITSAIRGGSMVARPGNIHPRVKMAVDNGRLAASAQLPGLSLDFAPSPAQQAALDALLTAQQTHGSPSYHQWLTPAQFGAQFGMSDGDLAKVTGWLQSRGFTVERVAPSRNAIHFSGTVEQVEQTFQTELHSLTLDGEAHFANTTEPSLPAAFAETVTAVGGLNNFHPKPHVHASAQQVPYAIGSRKVSSGLTPLAVDPSTGSEYVAPEDFAKIYDVNALYNAGFNGSASYPVGIIGETAVYTADLTAFRTAFGLTTTNLPTMVLEPNTGNSAVTTTGDLSESELDLEWAGAVAPSVPIYFIYTGNSSTNGSYNYGVFDALQYAIQSYTVNGKPVPILSISYGECEPSDTAANLASYESWFKQANAQGQTILSASGDEGAAGCDYATTAANSYSATQGLAVDYPSSSAYVTGVGGTSFSGDVSSKTTYWGTSNDNNFGNELGLYIPSSTWNDSSTTTAAISSKGLSASGGGVSALWPKPAWQRGTGVPADGKRDVPDVALSADPDHDGFLVCINSSCAGNSGYFNVYGGTSVAAPSFAGILALTEQKLGAIQGNLNPSLYTLATNATAYASAFHDITAGNNIVPCIVTASDPGCVGGSMGYSTTTGYDLVTGLGAPDAFNLANALVNVATLIATTDTLNYTPAAPVAGQAATFTAVITHATGSAVPTGSVAFTVDGATGSPTTVALDASGTAALPETFTTGGPHTVSAVYSGDTIYYGSTATATVTVAVPTTGAATATTLSDSPATIAVGGTLTLTSNVTSSTPGTLAGQVVFNTSAGTSLGTASVLNGVATLAVPVTLAKFVVGTNTITATYAGSTSYTPSSSTAASVTVTNPTITLVATNMTVASGGTGTSTVTVTSGGNYAGTVTLTASSASNLSGQYTFTPANVTVTSTTPGTSIFTLTGATGAAAGGLSTLPLKSGLSSLAARGGLTFAALLLFGVGGVRRRRLASLLTVLIFSALAAGLGCSSTSTVTTPTPTPKTGTYTVTVTATDTATSSISNSTTFTVTIQ